MFERMKPELKRKLGIGGLFLLVWMFIFELNYLFIGNYRVKIDLYFEIQVWLIYILIFFLNYYLLIPFLLLRKKILSYTLASVLMLSLAYFHKDFITRQHFEKIMPPTEMMRDLPKPDGHHGPEMGPDKFRIPGREPGRIVFVTYGLLLSYLFSLSIRFIQKWQEEDKRKAEIENANISTELSFLRQQVNPHFLFNSLNSIYSLALSKSDATLDAILKLSSLLRYMLYETEKPLVRISDELNAITDYVELHKLRITEKVKLTYNCNGNPGEALIAPFILIPIIENAFKYGTDSTHDSFIEIIVDIAEQKLNLKVSNTVVKQTDVQQNSGIGLKNIKRRLDLLYPEMYKLDINSQDSIFIVELEIKLK
jgi:two-component system, LytTR family, sensor kinase